MHGRIQELGLGPNPFPSILFTSPIPRSSCLFTPSSFSYPISSLSITFSLPSRLEVCDAPNLSKRVRAKLGRQMFSDAF